LTFRPLRDLVDRNDPQGNKDETEIADKTGGAAYLSIFLNINLQAI
jgi:hypothetical protein